MLSWIHKGVKHTHRLTEPRTLIGRQEGADLHMSLPSLSREHAVVERDGERYFITDLNSSMGSRLNGLPLKAHERFVLKEGDRIELGRQVFYFGYEAVDAGRDFGQTMEINFTHSKVLEETLRFRERMKDHVSETVSEPESAGQLQAKIDGEFTRLNDFIESKLREYEVLQEITQIIVRILDVKDLLSTALKLVSSVLKADRGFIILYDPKHGSLRSMIPRHFDQASGAYEFDLSFSQTIAKRCYDQKEIIMIADALKDERFHSAQSIVASSIRSVICIPLQHGSDVSGVIYLDSLTAPDLFQEHQTDFLRAFSAQTALALENARLYTQAVTDGLTRLYNRKFIDERIFEEMVRSRRYDRQCSLILLDIDHFKAVNDNHGHDFGDVVIEQVANALRESARTSDVVARYGGEEFLLLLTETDMAGAEVFAERLRLFIEDMPVSHEGTELKVTVSCGVSTYHPDLRNEVAAFVKLADQALYKAKEAGRNRVVSAE